MPPKKFCNKHRVCDCILFKPKEKPDQFKQAVMKAYKSTPVYTLDKLVLAEKKYLKRAIMAQKQANKIRKQINKFSYELIKKEMEAK